MPLYMQSKIPLKRLECFPYWSGDLCEMLKCFCLYFTRVLYLLYKLYRQRNLSPRSMSPVSPTVLNALILNMCLQVVLGSSSQLLFGAEETAADVHDRKWSNPSWRILKTSSHHCQEWSWFRQVHVTRSLSFPFKLLLDKETRIDRTIPWRIGVATVLIFRKNVV